MAFRSTLLLGKSKGSMVSPLVDVVFNLMITMFVFLMILMLFIRSDDHKLLHFLEGTLPDGVASAPYQSNIPVGGGSGDFVFLFARPAPDNGADAAHVQTAPSDSEAQGPPSDPAAFLLSPQLHVPGQGALEMDETSGKFNARFFPTGREAADCAFSVWVYDKSKVANLPLAKCVRLGDLYLYFWQEHRGGVDASTTETGASIETIEGYCAIRREFSVHVTPSSAPYDPESNPLRWEPSDRIEAVAGFPLEAPLRVLGGIEPYLLQLSNAPAWLGLDTERALLTGTPNAPCEFTCRIEIKDQQTPSWETARQSADEPGSPHHAVDVVVSVKAWHPLQVLLVLPPHSRQGSPVVGSITSSGGVGNRRLTAEGFPPGVELDPDTGIVGGTPSAVGTFDVRATVTDENPDGVHNHAETHLEWIVIPPQPAPRIVEGTPE